MSAAVGGGGLNSRGLAHLPTSQVYILQNNLGLTGGGARFLHRLHAALLRGHMDSAMHYVHPLLADQAFARNLSAEARCRGEGSWAWAFTGGAVGVWGRVGRGRFVWGAVALTMKRTRTIRPHIHTC